MSRLFQLFLVAGAVSFALGQATRQVLTGVEGSFYDPASLTAQLHDVVRFIFGGDIHDVTQSSFENPCVPLPGGFSSSFQGPGPNTSNPLVSWDLVITDDTQPIWFFCQATVPVYHCSDGMVGVINPPSNSMYEAYVSAAKAYTGSIPPSPTVALSGVGAIATASPAPTSISLMVPTIPPNTSAPSSTLASSTSAISPAQSSSAPSKSSNAAVIGGAVGGGVAAIIIAILAFLLWRVRRRSASRLERVTPLDHSQSQPYMDPSNDPGTPGLRQPLMMQKPMHSPSPSDLTFPTHPVTPDASQMYFPHLVVPSTIYTGEAPAYQRPLPPPPQHQTLHRQPSDQTLARTSDSGSAPLASVNINDLAREVAALISVPSATSSSLLPTSHGDRIIHQQRQKQVVNPSAINSDVSRTSSPAPPPEYGSE